MDKNNPLISIVINYWESIEYLDKCIDSIQNQSYNVWEIVFVDNNSNKSPEKILSRVSKEKLKYFRLNKYYPLGQARNFALDKCQGEFIAFIDADDIWLNEKLRLQVDEFKKNSKIGMVICKSNFIINNKIINKNIEINFEKESTLENLIYGNFIVMSSAIIRKNVIDENKIKFNKSFEVLEDTLFFFEIISKSSLVSINKVLCLWRYSRKSHTFRNTEKLLAEKIYFKKNYLEEAQNKKIISDNSMLNYNLNLKILEGSSKLYINKPKETRAILKPFLKKTMKLIIVYFISFLPRKLCFFMYENIFKSPLI